MKGKNKVRIIKDCIAVEDKAFQNDNEMNELVICEGVTRIGAEAFADCSKLKKVVIPESITYIANSAFRNSGIQMKVPCKEKREFTLLPTMLIFCKENSYADEWLKQHKKGHIKVYAQ